MANENSELIPGKMSHEMSNDEFVAFLDDVVLRFTGNAATLDRALGMYLLARAVGWKPTFLMRDKRKIKEAEEILGITFRDHFPELGEKPNKSISWKMAQKFSSFWRAVRGDFPDVRTSKVGPL